MSIVQTLAVFLVIPLAVILVVAALILGMGGRSTPRYRPGRPFRFSPVWFVSAGAQGTTDRPGATAIAAAPDRPALNSGATSITALAEEQTGGARGAW